MNAKLFCLMSVALWANLLTINSVWGDQPAQSNIPAAAIPANTTAPTQDSPPASAPATKPTLRDKLLHWPAMVHSKPPCKDCGLTDPDFCCQSCRSQWIFLFGSCRAFYGDNRTWK